MKLGIKPWHIVLLLVIVLAIPAHNLYFTGTISGNGFAESDIAGVKNSIRKNIEKNSNLKVEHIAMIIRTSKDMTGFVKIRTPDGKLIQQECSAQIGSGRHIIWKCSSE